MNKLIVGLLAGLLFGLGLLIGGMANPAKVLNFLDVAGHWDPSLAFVMGGALLVTIPGFWLSKKRSGSFSGWQFQWPSRSDIDAPLLLGASMFGIGWGLVGFCPGPALVAAGDATTAALIFLFSMLVGVLAYELFQRSKTKEISD